VLFGWATGWIGEYASSKIEQIGAITRKPRALLSLVPALPLGRSPIFGGHRKGPRHGLRHVWRGFRSTDQL